MLNRSGGTNIFVETRCAEGTLRVATQGSAHATIHMSKSRTNATLRDGQGDGLPVDAFPSG